MDVSLEVDKINIHSLGINENNTDKNVDEKVSDIDNQTLPDARRPRRSGRCRLRQSMEPSMISEKSRVISRPKKLNLGSSLKAIESYYMNKKIKSTLSPALETIFEHPTDNVVMSSKKLRRCINFTNYVGQKPDKSKEKKRKVKAKSVLKSGYKKMGKKIGLELLINKLKGLDDDDADDVK